MPRPSYWLKVTWVDHKEKNATLCSWGVLGNFET